MKSIIYTLLFSLLLVSCEKDYVYIKKIRLKGKISTTAKALNSPMKAPSASFTLADAAQVLIFYGNEYDLVDIKSDGSFSGRAPLGSASCVVFLTKSNEYIGNLFVGGCNLLPLVSMDDKIDEIDFSTLTLSGTRVIPANDPIGTTIKLTDKELAFLGEIDSYYEALAKNIDMNNNGKPDVIEGNQIQLYGMYSFGGGTWGTTSKSPSIKSKSAITFDQGIHLVGPNELLSNTENSVAENATLSGPTANPHTNIINSGNSYINNKEFKVNFGRRAQQQQGSTQFLPFDDGIYTFNIDNKSFTFNYVNVDMLDYLIVAIPTLNINASNQLTSVTISYQLSDGSPVTPRNIMSSGIDVNVAYIGANGVGFMDEVLSPTGAKYDDKYDYYKVELEKPLDMKSISNIRLSYFDILGNQYGVGWSDK
ncbi:MAG: hypothetical protein ACOYM7_10505 [Paludibacter sp.]